MEAKFGWTRHKVVNWIKFYFFELPFSHDNDFVKFTIVNIYIKLFEARIEANLLSIIQFYFLENLFLYHSNILGKLLFLLCTYLYKAGINHIDICIFMKYNILIS